MKTLTLTLILFFVTNSYYTQSLKDFDLNTKTFDINTYNKNKGEGGYYTFYIGKNIEVWQYPNSRGGVRERITHRGDPYSVERIYYLDGKLRYAKRSFYGFGIGNSLDYDEKGNLEKPTNWDYLYTFSIEDLIKKMKEQYGIDISVYIEGLDVGRNYTSPSKNTKPEYSVSEYNLDEDSLVQKRDGGIIRSREYYIDGSNGNTTKIEERVYMGKEQICEDEECSNYHNSYTFRVYEMNSGGEVLKITQTKESMFKSYDVPKKIFEEKVIYEKEGYKEGVYKMYKDKNYIKAQYKEIEEQEDQSFLHKKNAFDTKKLPCTKKSNQK